MHFLVALKLSSYAKLRVLPFTWHMGLDFSIRVASWSTKLGLKHPLLDFAFELRIRSKVEDWDLKLGEYPWVGADEI